MKKINLMNLVSVSNVFPYNSSIKQATIQKNLYKLCYNKDMFV